MRLAKGSLTLFLLCKIAWYGNFPYHALRLYPCNYESLKDACQKLMRVGYVDTVKVINVKSLHLTAKGKTALREKLKKLSYEGPHIGDIKYTPRKALRADLLNETQIFFGMAELDEKLFPSSNIRRHLEMDSSRAADMLQYSRYCGIFQREFGFVIVYHFGHSNRVLNKNGEENVAVTAKRLFPATLPDGKVDNLWEEPQRYMADRLFQGNLSSCNLNLFGFYFYLPPVS